MDDSIERSIDQLESVIDSIQHTSRNAICYLVALNQVIERLKKLSDRDKCFDCPRRGYID